MILKPQDILVMLKLVSKGSSAWTNASIASELGMSSSEIYAALKRAAAAHLFNSRRRRVSISDLEEFLIHGVKYAYPAVRGELTRGIPTAYGASPLVEMLAEQPVSWPPVWPDPHGSARGYELKPLYKSVPQAALKDARLYELLALVDAIREGRPRERKLAIDELKFRLNEYLPEED